jgi:Ca2+-binding RTX toxin-like protein
LTGGGGPGTDTLVATKNGDFTLTDTTLTVKEGSPTTLNLTLSGIAIANLTGGAGNNKFTVTSWTGGGSINGMGASDTIVKVADVNFVLSDAALTAGPMSVSLVSIETANLTGGAGNNTFDVGGWTHQGKLEGKGNTADKIIVSKSANITLTSGSVSSNDGLSMTIATIEQAELTGGSGNDQIIASAFGGTATLNGLGGSDILIGGAGANILNGGAGRDFIIGGDGADTLNGDADGDLLVGGRTSYGVNVVALDKILDEWTSANAYATRVANILTGGGATAGNALNSGTVLADAGAVDTLTGGTDPLDLDWFFKEAEDTVVDQEAGETITPA